MIEFLSILNIIFHRFNSSIVELHKITPLSAEKHILDEFYGRTKRFTNAVNQMKKVQQSISEEKELKRTNRMKTHTKDDQQQSFIEKVQQRTIKIVLTRLKPEEIDKWTSKRPKSFAMVLRKR